jgi:hypothetical protein
MQDVLATGRLVERAPVRAGKYEEERKVWKAATVELLK